MNLKHLKNEHSNNRLPDKEWESITQILINAKFDEEKQHAYQIKLEQEGIHRSSSVKAKRIVIRRSLLVAASLFFLILTGWYLWPASQSATQLATQYLEQTFAIDDGSIRGSGGIEKTKGKAIEAYNNQQYVQALKYLQLIETEGQASAKEYFQMGLCLIYKPEPNYQNALLAFREAQKRDPLVYKDEINWFSALCHILLMNGAEAKRLLSLIIQSPGSRQQKEAKKLLDKLYIK